MKNVKPRNDKGQLHGYCVWYWRNGTIQCEANLINGVEQGLTKYYHRDGNLSYKEYYI